LSNWLLGVVLGIVQGVSEWLPISSKTQVIVVSTFLYGLTFQEAYALGLLLEGATFVASLTYFRREAYGVLKALIGRGNAEGRMLLRFLLVVTAVTALLGVAIYVTVSETVTGAALGLPMIILGCVLIGDGFVIKFARGRGSPTRGLADLRMRDLLLIGIAQGIAAFPGVSRSGVTVSAMLLLGVHPKEAFRLSFLALIPASIGAAGVTLVFSSPQIGATVDTLSLYTVILAGLVAVVVGLVTIKALLRVAASKRITVLVFGLGILAIASGVSSIVFGVGG
jgi:undecaprenyl-diphosphatase